MPPLHASGVVPGGGVEAQNTHRRSGQPAARALVENQNSGGDSILAARVRKRRRAARPGRISAAMVGRG